MPLGRDPELVAFGTVVRKARHARDLSQEELAELAGLHPTQVSFVERARREVKILTMLKLARGLDMTPGQLWTAYDEQTLTE